MSEKVGQIGGRIKDLRRPGGAETTRKCRSSVTSCHQSNCGHTGGHGADHAIGAVFNHDAAARVGIELMGRQLEQVGSGLRPINHLG